MCRFVGGRPNSLQHSYFTRKLAVKAQALLKSVDIEEGTVAYLQRHGHVQTGYADEFDARPPTEQELRFFGLSTRGQTKRTSIRSLSGVSRQ